MPSPGRQIWLDALQSGDYKQGWAQLGNEATGYCCLGLACKLAVDAGVIESYNSTLGTLATLPAVQRWVGLSSYAGDYGGGWARRRLTQDNDRGTTFAEIAATIEAAPLGLLTDA